MAAMTAKVLRTLEEFVPGTGALWPLYLERLKFYLIANDITNGASKRAVLCTFRGAATYAIIHSLFSPPLSLQAIHENIVLKCAAHINLRPSVIVQRFQYVETRPALWVEHP